MAGVVYFWWPKLVCFILPFTPTTINKSQYRCAQFYCWFIGNLRAWAEGFSSHTLVLYTNHLPKVGAIDAGTWRRLIVVPFNARITGSGDIKNYAEYLYENDKQRKRAENMDMWQTNLIRLYCAV